ncbi:MAG: nucleotide exchange factor GrpE [Clostridia bacterium]|nr:nucleotide exchange factor GrpE [Clostridia bacterium]MBQ2315749.1 nucleotide exchange factor GrpE [Clostridia bacterium]MEE0808993.1 nucleotide exchange factor GrpE [Acutalibacteraceae bacterium]
MEDVKNTNNEATVEEKKEKKKSKKDLELEALKAELEAKNDLLARTAAEFDNYKKRTEREKSGVAEFAKAGIIKQLLPILDNIDRAAASDKESADYIKGIELIVKQFEALGTNLGIVEVAAAGDSFDPNFHEAVMHVEDETLGENVIAEVLQKGYKLGDTVIRPAMVKVAN